MGTALKLLAMTWLLAAVPLAFAAEPVPLAAQAPEIVAQARADGVPDAFLDAGAVTASIVRYDRPMAEILFKLTGQLSYRQTGRHHVLFRTLPDPDRDEILTVEYRFVVVENGELLLEEIVVNGRAADPYGEFFQYADELCRKRENQPSP